jgi:molecular chaperone GrpE
MTAKPEHTPPPENETLAQRSARLEAEATRLMNENKDVPAPEEGAPAPTSPDVDVVALQAELAQAKDQTLRAMADAENTRRRAVKDREDASKFAISSFARDLLSVADNLRRALDAIPADLPASDPRIKNLMDGIEATEREMLRTFEKNGIQKINPLDQPFNANFHEVMFEVPGTGKPPDTVIQVVEVGYILNERLLRPARVGVAKDDSAAVPGGHIDTQA